MATPTRTMHSLYTEKNYNVHWGVTKDCDVIDSNPSLNYGASTGISVGTYSGDRAFILLHLKMPPEPPDAGEIKKIRLYLYRHGTQPTHALENRILMVYQLFAANGFFVQGNSNGSVDRRGCSWDERMRGKEWADGKKEDNDTPQSSLELLTGDDSIGWKWFDMLDSDISWGSDSEYVIKQASDKNVVDKFWSNRYTQVTGHRPHLEIEYVFKEESTPEGEESFLEVEPNPSNPEQALLTWKRPKNRSLKMDDGQHNGAFCLIRHTSTIPDYTTGTLIARTSSLEHIDDIMGDSHDGIPYYYRVLICDEQNYVEGTGIDVLISTYDIIGLPVFSNEVVMEKPKANSFTMISPYSVDVWETKNFNVECVAPVLSNIGINAYQYDWQGDSSETGWKELETPSNTDSQDYLYTSAGSGPPYEVTPKVRIRNSLGFWSSQYDLDDVITLSPIDAIAEARVSPKQVNVFEGFRIRADESQDRNADGELTKYRFQVKHTFGTTVKYWTGVAGGWSATPTWIDQGLTTYIDIPGSAITEEGNYFCRSEVTGLSGNPVVSPGAEILLAVDITPTDIRTGLSSNAVLTYIDSGRDTLTTKNVKLQGTESIRIVEGVESETRRIEGISRRSNYLDDILQLYEWQEQQSLMKYFYDEPINQRYITFRITRFRERRRDKLRATWSLEIDVEGKTT